MTDWKTLGKGAGKSEVVRMCTVNGGWLVATVQQTVGYKSSSLTENNDEKVVKDERTVAMTFIPTGEFGPPE